ncbi:MAG: 2-oxo acid dehydrogenase subunit E2 [Ktedonobacterales bacterium]|nr:2-oxo acid dehydrogenase subunit E2 [Ktedonobacterales bacterium]
MPTKITMPQLGESVSEGTIGRWLKHEGDSVKKDESLVEIVTDKVTAELPSPVSGRLVRILVREDETAKVGAEIAEIEESGGNGASAPSSTSGASTTMGQASGGPSASRADGSSASAAPSAPNGGAPNGGAAMSSSAPLPHATATAERISPLARRMAQEHGVDLNAIQGTGEGGRVRKEDILAHVAQRGASGQVAVAMPPLSAPTYAAPAPPVVAPLAGDEVITPTPARRAIAEHMVRSKHTSPHAWTSVEVDVTNLARWLERHKEAFKAREGYGISYQTFAIKATVEAIREHPYVNASWTEEGKILLRHAINVGMSIALENNLIVPVIRNADTLSIAGIARAVSDLVSRARSRKLMPADTQGATFTVNNPGVFGTILSMAIINQPNAAILTMDSVVKRPVVVDDAIAIRQMMFLSLSFDHRVLDGLTAAQFLGAVKRRLEGWGPEIDCY